MQVLECDAEIVINKNSEFDPASSEDEACEELGTFQSEEEMVAFARSLKHSEGICFNIGRSRRNTTYPSIKFICSRGGSYKPPTSGRKTAKNTASNKTQCPWFMIARCGKKSTWTLRQSKTQHNHKPLDNLAGDPAGRRPSREQLERIAALKREGIRPSKMLNILSEEWPDFRMTVKDIANAAQKLSHIESTDTSSIEALMEHLTSSPDWAVIAHLKDDDNHLTHLFIMHSLSRIQIQSSYRAFIVDSIYKTNRWNLPLLHIVGVDCLNRTFSAGYCFMRDEGISDYSWAVGVFRSAFDNEQHLPVVFVTDQETALIRALEEHFPSSTKLLCSWRIHKKVLTNCKKDVGDEGWTEFLGDYHAVASCSESTEEAERSFLSFFEKYHSKHPVSAHYVKKVIWPLREKFIPAWTNKNLTFGHNVISRVEGYHFVLKRELPGSMGNLTTVVTTMEALIKEQYAKSQSMRCTQTQRVMQGQSNIIMKEIVRKVSYHALNMIMAFYQLALKRQRAEDESGIVASYISPICRCHITSTHGIPCEHVVFEFLQRQESLSLQDINSQWHLQSSIFPLKPRSNAHCEETLQSNTERSANTDFAEKNDRASNSVHGELDSYLSAFIQRYQATPRSQLAQLQYHLDIALNQGLHLFNNPLPLTRVMANGIKRRADNEEIVEETLESLVATSRDEGRLPSAFKMMEPPVKVRKCGMCYEPGHTARACPSIHPEVGSQKQIQDENITRRKSESYQEFSNILTDFWEIKPDGNCGFRALAHRYCDNGEEEWYMIRMLMKEVLVLHKLLLTSSESEYIATLSGLDSFVEHCDKSKWFVAPEMARLAAVAFDRPIIVISKVQSFTYLPIKGMHQSKLQPWVMVFQADHFDAGEIREDIAPPIDPWWIAFAQKEYVQDSDLWLHKYQPLIEKWKSVVNSDGTNLEENWKERAFDVD